MSAVARRGDGRSTSPLALAWPTSLLTSISSLRSVLLPEGAETDSQVTLKPNFADASSRSVLLLGVEADSANQILRQVSSPATLALGNRAYITLTFEQISDHADGETNLSTGIVRDRGHRTLQTSRATSVRPPDLVGINSGSTIGVEFGSSVFFVDEKTIRVQIRDTGRSRETLPPAHLNLTYNSRPRTVPCDYFCVRPTQ
jgi:hypothetical protein